MAEAAFAYMDLGPFDRIVGFSRPSVSWSLRIRRDDGLVYAPESEEGVVIQLFDTEWTLLFEGYSQADPDLLFASDIPDLVSGFGFHDQHYVITFSLTVVEEVLFRQRNDLFVYVRTDGSGTLETTHPRCYTDAREPFPIAPGRHEITIPFWDKVNTTGYAGLATTIKTSTLYSSVPFTAYYIIANANACGLFRFPVLVVEWSPNNAMTGWRHDFRFYPTCLGVGVYLPSQSLPGLTAPDHPPATPQDRLVSVLHDVEVEIALDSCLDQWSWTRIGVSTNFGYAATIHFAPDRYTLFDAEFPLPAVFEPNLFGQPFARTWRFLWNRTSFTYDTGVWPQMHANQVAQLAQSPRTYDAIHLLPAPE
ncbi:MAG: hypothetical protein HQM03_11885 [Magnetococcales bacterium]|nr:hypothetical protein [Magnetococcales bacterium]